MGALAHFIEEEGIPTTQISLIRRHTEIIRPPRALWVPFDFGRPLGAPNNPGFQKQILVAVLRLLEIPEGSVLQDFPYGAPVSENRVSTLSCPINPIRVETEVTEIGKLCLSFKTEITALRSWYEIAVAKHGRTTVGASRIEPDEIGNLICSFLRDTQPDNPRKDVSLADMLKLSVDDLKAYYFEAITSQPGQEDVSIPVFSDWFWRDTRAGQVLMTLKEVCLKSENSLLQRVGRALIVPSRVARTIGKSKDSE